MPVHRPPGPGTRCGSIPGPWLPQRGWRSTRPNGSDPSTRGRPSTAHRGSWSRPGLRPIAGEVRDLHIHVTGDVEPELSLFGGSIGDDHRQVPSSAAAEGCLLGCFPVPGIPHLAGGGIANDVGSHHLPGPTDLDGGRVHLVAHFDLLAE